MKKILLMFCMLAICLNVYAAVEDFSTWEITADEDSDMTITATKIETATRRNDANTYTGTDKGAGHFGNFSHTIDHFQTGSQANSRHIVWAVTNTATGTEKDLVDGDDGIWVKWEYYTPASPDELRLFLEVHTAGTDDSDFNEGDVNGQVYLTVIRTGATITCEIYSDSGRETLVDTLSVTHDAGTFRYLFAGSGAEDTVTTSQTFTGNVENLDLNEAAAGRTRRMF